MTKIIEGIPENISRADYARLIASVGFDPMQLLSLTFEAEGVRARVAATGDDGREIFSPTDEDEFAVACHDIFIPVIDEATA